MKNKRGFSTLLSAILVLAVVVAAVGGYLYWKTTPTPQTQEISRAVVPVVETSASSPAVQAGQEKIVEHTSQAVLNSLDAQRQQSDNQRIKSNLSSFRASAEIYYINQNPTSYGLAVRGPGGCSAQGSMFTSNTYTGNENYKAILDQRDYPPNTQFACNVSAEGSAYALQASLVGGGYWCIDSTGQSKLESSSLGIQTQCQ